MSDWNNQEQVKIDGFRVSGPVAGKRIEVEFDVKPARRKGSRDYYKESDEWDSIGFLFLLLFGLIFFIGNTAGTGENPFPTTSSPAMTQFNSR